MTLTKACGRFFLFKSRSLAAKALETLERARLSLRGKSALGSPRKILLICARPMGIGDLIMDTPFIRTLRKGYPKARIELLTDKDILSEGPFIDAIQLLPRERRKEEELIAQLRKERYDLVIVMNRGIPQTWLAHAVRPRHLAGYLAGWKVRATFPLRKEERFTKDEHFWNMALKIADCMGLARDERLIPLTFDEKTEKKMHAVTQKARGKKEKLIIISPYVLWESRRWDEEGYAKLAQDISSECGIILLGSKNAKERSTLERVNKLAKSAFPIIDDLTLKESACLIKHADLFISNDAGPMHLAFAVGTPTLSLFGPIDPAHRLPPDNPMHQAIRGRKTEKYTYEHETITTTTLRGITPKIVEKEARKLLGLANKKDTKGEKMKRSLGTGKSMRKTTALERHKRPSADARAAGEDGRARAAGAAREDSPQ